MCIVCAINTAAVLAQNVAPGDEPQLCQVLREAGIVQTPNYNPSMGILMDSDNYQNLLPPHSEAVWQQVDNDVKNDPSLTTNVSLIINFVASYERLFSFFHFVSGFRILTCPVIRQYKSVALGRVHRTTG